MQSPRALLCVALLSKLTLHPARLHSADSLNPRATWFAGKRRSFITVFNVLIIFMSLLILVRSRPAITRRLSCRRAKAYGSLPHRRSEGFTARSRGSRMDTQVVLTLVPSAARGPRKRRPSACGEIILSGPTKDDKAMQYSCARLGKLAGVALRSPRVLARHARCNRSQAGGAICGGGRAPPAPPRAGSDPGCFSTVRVRTRQKTSLAPLSRGE